MTRVTRTLKRGDPWTSPDGVAGVVVEPRDPEGFLVVDFGGWLGRYPAEAGPPPAVREES